MVNFHIFTTCVDVIRDQLPVRQPRKLHSQKGIMENAAGTPSTSCIPSQANQKQQQQQQQQPYVLTTTLTKPRMTTTTTTSTASTTTHHHGRNTHHQTNKNNNHHPSMVVSLVHEFCTGVTACLRSWSALRAAVEGGWGGVESHAKAEFLRETIYQYFLPNRNNNHNGTSSSPRLDIKDDDDDDHRKNYPTSTKKRSHVDNHSRSRSTPMVSLEELEDHLAIYLEEEFAVQLEDDSERQVARTIWDLYETCLIQGTPSLARRVIESVHIQQQQPFSLQVQTSPEALDDEDEIVPVGNSSNVINHNNQDENVAMQVEENDYQDQAHSATTLPLQQPCSSSTALPLPTTPTTAPVMASAPPLVRATNAGDPHIPLDSSSFAMEPMEPLFAGGPTKLQDKAQKTTTHKPIRQLGQVAEEADNNNNKAADVDQDGFAMVIRSKKKQNKKKKIEEQQPEN